MAKTEEAKYILTIGKGDEMKTAKLREIDRTTFKLAMNKTFAQEQFEAGEIILTACLIKSQSDEEILKDDSYYCSAVMQAFGLIDLKEGELKKV